VQVVKNSSAKEIDDEIEEGVGEMPDP